MLIIQKLKQNFPGLLFTTFIALSAIRIQNTSFFQSINLSSLIIAILIGMFIKNIFIIPAILGPGINFSMKTVLRLSIILLGFKLSFSDLNALGEKTLLLITLITLSTLLFTFFIGKKLKLNTNLSLLIASGCSICGAAAIAAVAPTIDAEKEETTFAIATITIFGTISMFIYPLLFHLFDMSNMLYAVWVGSSIHEVAQVVAAGFAGGTETGQYATLVKLARVLLIIPTTILLAYFKPKKTSSTKISKVTVPWFVFGFIFIVILNSSNIIPESIIKYLNSINNLLLTIAMVAMGLEINFNKIKSVGLKPIYLGLFASIFITSISYFLTSLLYV